MNRTTLLLSNAALAVLIQAGCQRRETSERKATTPSLSG